METKAKKNDKKIDFEGTIASKVDYAVFKDVNLDRDTIKAWLKKDMFGVYIILAELLASNEALEALADVFYKRYEKLHENKDQVELKFNDHDKPRGN